MKHDIMVGKIGVEIIEQQPNTVQIRLVTSDIEKAKNTAAQINKEFPEATSSHLFHDNAKDEYYYTLTDPQARGEGLTHFAEKVTGLCVRLEQGYLAKLAAKEANPSAGQIPSTRSR